MRGCGAWAGDFLPNLLHAYISILTYRLALENYRKQLETSSKVNGKKPTFPSYYEPCVTDHIYLQFVMTMSLLQGTKR